MKLDDSDFSYDSIAEDYASRVDDAPYNAHYERPAMLAQLPDIQGKRVFDAGCGSGWYSAELLSREAVVDAVDASASMVEHARKRLLGIEAGNHSQLRSIGVGDLSKNLSFADSTFDAILSPLVLHYMKDWRPALKEFRRVLKPNGWLLFSTHHPAADASRFETQDYFSTEHIVDHWENMGEVQFYRRSLTEIFSSVKDGGFVIESLIEPVPTERFRELKPDSWTRLMNQPEFLIIKARPSPQ